MKAALLSAFGPPEALRLTDVRSPVLGEGMVRVRVHTIGLNFADVFARLGVYPGIPKVPFVPGIEFAGEVIEKDHGVRLRLGSRVVGFTRQGAYAEEVCVPAHFVYPIPSTMPYESAAAFLVTYMSAWHGMRTLAQVRKGETVLIHAAAGGVGTAALQLGTAWGCRLIGTASTAEKLEVALHHGAHHAINYATDDFEQRIRETIGRERVDVVMDSIGGRVMKKSWRLLAPMGRYVLFGFAAAAGKRRLHYLRLLREILAFPFLIPSSFPTRNVSLMGFNLYFLADKTDYHTEAGKQLLELFKKGKIAPLVGRVYPFDEIVQAHEFLQSRRSIGKVVLKVR